MAMKPTAPPRTTIMMRLEQARQRRHAHLDVGLVRLGSRSRASPRAARSSRRPRSCASPSAGTPAALERLGDALAPADRADRLGDDGSRAWRSRARCARSPSPAAAERRSRAASPSVREKRATATSSIRRPNSGAFSTKMSQLSLPCGRRLPAPKEPDPARRPAMRMSHQ